MKKLWQKTRIREGTMGRKLEMTSTPYIVPDNRVSMHKCGCVLVDGEVSTASEKNGLRNDESVSG